MSPSPASTRAPASYPPIPLAAAEPGDSADSLALAAAERARLLPQLLARPGRRPSAGERLLTLGSLHEQRATIALSSELRVGFVFGKRPVRHGELEARGLSLHHGWETACDSLLDAATTKRGLRFSYRPARSLAGPATPDTAVQIACHGTEDPTRWLTHPRAFTLMHQHFSRLLGFYPVYLAPREGVLLAASPIDAEHPALSLWSQGEARAAGPRALGPGPIEYAHGFPRRLEGAAARV